MDDRFLAEPARVCGEAPLRSIVASTQYSSQRERCGAARQGSAMQRGLLLRRKIIATAAGVSLLAGVAIAQQTRDGPGSLERRRARIEKAIERLEANSFARQGRRTTEGCSGTPYAPNDYESDMPAFRAKLSDEEIWAVLAYIKSHWKSPELLSARQVMTGNARRK